MHKKQCSPLHCRDFASIINDSIETLEWKIEKGYIKSPNLDETGERKRIMQTILDARVAKVAE